MRMKLFGCFLLLFFIAFYGEIQGQQICIEKYKPAANHELFFLLYALECDSDGYVYLATDNGIFVYNGNTLEKHKGDRNSGDIINLYKDSQGRIWALPYNGKIRWVNSNDNQLQELRFFGNNNYKALYAYRGLDSIIYFQIEYHNKQYEGKLFPDSRIQINRCINIVEGFYNHYFNQFHLPASESKPILDRMRGAPTQENRFIDDRYLAIGNILYYFERGKSKIMFDGAKYGFQNSFIVDFYLNGKNGIYIAFYGETKGLYYFSEFKRMVPIYKESNVNSVIKNKFGSLYFSTHGNSLFAIKYAHAIKYEIKLHQTEIIQSVMLIPQSEHLILQSDQRQLYYYNIETAALEKLRNLGEDGVPFLFKADSNLGLLRSNDYYQLDQLLQSRKKRIFHNTEVGSSIINIIRKDHELFIFCKTFLIVCNLVDNSSKQFNYDFNLNDISTLKNNEIELYTNHGIYKAVSKSSTIVFIQIDSTKVGESEIMKVCKDSGFIYCLTPRSVLRRSVTQQEEVLFMLPVKNQMFKVNSILAEDRYLFFVKNKQLDFFDKLTKQYYRYIIPFLENDEYLLGGFVDDGQLYYYTPTSLYTLPISFFDKINVVPDVKLSSIKYNRKIIYSKNDSLVLQYKADNSLKLTFDYLNGIFLDNDLISFKLVHGGEILEESSIHNNEILLKNLDYGMYALKLFFQHREFMVIRLDYQPFWYQTYFFKISLAILFSAFLVYLIYLFFHRNFLRKKQEMELKMNLLKLEGGAKLNQLKPHFIFNSLIPIQNYILKNKKDEALGYLDEFSSLIRAMLNMSRDSSTTLSKEIEFLNKFLQLKKSELSNDLSYEIRSDFDNTEASFIKIPTLLIQPIVENAIAYGKGVVKVQFQRHSEYLVDVIVSDNGNGFDLLADADQSTENHALNIIQERLALYQNSKRVSSELTTFFKDQFFHVKISIPIFI